MAKSKKEREIEAAAKAEMEKQAQEATAAQEAEQAPAAGQEAPQAAQDTEKPADSQEGAQDTQDAQEGAQGGEEDKQPQEGTQDAEQDEDAQEGNEGTAEAEVDNREKVQGNVLVIYNGFVNLRRSPSMTADNIMGTAGRGTVLNAVAEVEASGCKWYETLGGVYIRADEALVEFMRSK